MHATAHLNTRTKYLCTKRLAITKDPALAYITQELIFCHNWRHKCLLTCFHVERFIQHVLKDGTQFYLLDAKRIPAMQLEFDRNLLFLSWHWTVLSRFCQVKDCYWELCTHSPLDSAPSSRVWERSRALAVPPLASHWSTQWSDHSSTFTCTVYMHSQEQQ